MFPAARPSAVVASTLLCLAICLTTVAGQGGPGPAGQPQPPPPPQQPVPVIRSGTVAVLVDVYPQKDGRIVPGLTPADFQVFEDGKPQQIETLEFVRIEPAPPDATRRDPNNTREMNALVADPRKRVFVAFLDEFHTTTSGSNLIRQPLLDMIDQAVGPEDLIGVMTPRMRPQDLTFGRERLAIEEQLTRYWTWGQRQRTVADRPDPMEEALRVCYRERRTTAGLEPLLVNDGGARRPLDEILIERRREHRTLEALGDLVQYLGGLREARTVLVLVSDGWMLFGPDRALAELAVGSGPTTPASGIRLPGVFSSNQNGLGSSEALFAQCAAEAARVADIDSPRVLRDIIARANRGNVSIYPVATAGLAAFDSSLSENLVPVGPQGLTRDVGRISNRVSSLRTIAENTDGIAVVQTNDLGAGLRRITDDVSGYYLLGYTPSNTRLDGAFRRIEVKVGVPGLSVRARRGYFGPTETSVVASAPAAPAATAAGVAEALAALSSIPPVAELHTAARVSPGSLGVVVELGSRSSQSLAAGAGRRVVVDAQRAAGGDVLTGTAEIGPDARSTLVRLPIGEGAGPWRVRVQVTTNGGTLTDQKEVSDERAALLGGLVAFRGRPAPRSPLSPVAGYQYPRTERLRFQWDVLSPVDRLAARLLDKRGQVLAAAIPVSRGDAGGQQTASVDLNLAPFARGEYVVEVTAESSTASEQQFVAFRVVQ